MKTIARISSLLILALVTLSLNHKLQADLPNSIVYNASESDTVIIQPLRVNAFDLPLIPPASGVQFYKDGIIFLASSKSRVNMLPDHVSFGTISTYYAEISENSLGGYFPFSQAAPFTYPSDGITFNKDYTIMYFTRNAGDGTLKIHKAEYSQGDWIIANEPLEFCSDNATYTHPALSLDGKIMVFSSNRSGSYGGMDLYVTINTDGKWAEPVNMGNAVNSTFNEVFPFLDAENNLFFSSDNIQGFGGYDIYVCKFIDNTWERPINLATPINTIYDDVAFTIDRNNSKTAFYTVKENLGRTYIQLYKVDMLKTTLTEGLNLSQYLTRPDIAQMVILALEPAVQATDRPAEPTRRTTTRGEDDKIVYRVQFLTSFNPKTRPQLAIEERIYPVYEYLYAGAYRLCVGEYATLNQALELQRLLIENDYPNASVVVFRNDVISFDTDLLAEEGATGQAVAAKQPADAKAVTPVIKPEEKKADPVKVVIPKTEEKKVEPDKAIVPPTKQTVPPVKEATTTKSATAKDVVVYRVQLLSNPTAKGSYEVKVNNTSYKTYEYLYQGAHRTCIGEFSTLAPATELQNAARKAGYPQAFVVAFKNNVRSTDPALFR